MRLGGRGDEMEMGHRKLMACCAGFAWDTRRSLEVQKTLNPKGKGFRCNMSLT